MSPRTLVIRSQVHVRSAIRSGGRERGILTACLLAFVLSPAFAREAFLRALEDAFLGVGVFVAFTFALFFWLEGVLKLDTKALLARNRKWELPLAALLGALPGCGGAVMVMTQYALQRASFGAVVAVLTATMGDAVFLILAQRPGVALLLIVGGFCAGVLSGALVNWLHGPGFMRVKQPARPAREEMRGAAPHQLCSLWSLIALPAFVLGALLLFQLDLPGPLTATVGVLGGSLSILIWALSPSQAAHMAGDAGTSSLSTRVALNTNFVTVWVVFSFFVFEVVGGAERLTPWFEAAPSLVPLVGVLIGFLPGCGPQILVTTLYLAGLVPLSAQVGNALSNDGDALFPALAIAPRAALVATLYTALPALLAAYATFLLV